MQPQHCPITAKRGSSVFTEKCIENSHSTRVQMQLFWATQHLIPQAENEIVTLRQLVGATENYGNGHRKPTPHQLRLRTVVTRRQRSLEQMPISNFTLMAARPMGRAE